MSWVLKQGDFKETLKSIMVDLIVTSPPYNIGSKCERRDGQRKLGKYDPKSFGAIREYPDNMPEDEYQESQRKTLIWCAKHIKDNGVICYNHKPRHKKGRVLHPYSWFPSCLVLHDEIIWDRGSTHNHCQSFLYQQTERIYIFKKSIKAKIYINPTELKHSDVWRIPPQRQVLKKHDAPFPLEIPRRCIRLFSRLGDLVCDPYAGFGTTAIAALLEDRNFVGSELCPKYVTRTTQRIQEFINQGTI
jgi:DNA modification methylase